MNIAHLVASLESRHGGPSRSVPGLARAMGRAGNTVALLTSAPADAPDERAPGFVRHTFRRGRPEMFCPVPGLSRHLRSLQVDIVHHHGLWLRPLHYAHREAQRRRVPLVLSPRGMMSGWAWQHHRQRKAWTARLVHPGALAAVNGWHATSTEEAADIRKLGFNQPICITPNGVDLPSPPQLQVALDHWRTQAPATATRPTALFYSRFHSKKRLIELIDAWAATAPREWLLLVVGIPDEFNVRQLRDYTRKVLAADRIEVHDGTYQPPPYAVASVLLLPSHSENFGLVVAEALAAGVPALVTEGMPWSELHERGAGWCVPWSAFPERLAKALALGPERLRARGIAGRLWMEQAFSWDATARPLLQFYAELVAGDGTRRST